MRRGSIGYNVEVMRHFQPKMKGEVQVRPGRRVVWLSRPSSLSVGLFVTSLVLFGMGAFVLGIPVGPMIWYSIKPSVTLNLAALLHQPVVSPQDAVKPARTVSDWQPILDDKLSSESRIVIPAIGVTTSVVEAPSQDYEQALKQGVWRVPTSGTPFDRTKPMIVVAHRFGYLSWPNRYRREHSFFNLPKLEVGNVVEIDWGQRKYQYQIYAGDEGTQISDYSADLILYTCQYLESDRRIFKYARLLEK